jgi:hypothetical protein
MWSQLWNNGAPLAVNRVNFPELGWRFAGNETPEDMDGSLMRKIIERTYNTDAAGPFGFFGYDFVNQFAFRDAIDMGTTSELRQLVSIGSGVTLTNPRLETTVESVFSAGAAA